MKVFKFGGASIKDPKGIRNIARIIQQYSGQPLLVVVSAMGKTTNALEKIHELSHAKKEFKKELENHSINFNHCLLSDWESFFHIHKRKVLSLMNS